MKITIGRKLFALSGISAALVLAVGVAAYWGVSKMSTATNVMMNREAKLLEYADNVKIYTLELRRAEKDIFLNIEDPETMDKYMGTFKEQQGNLSKALEKTKTVAASSEDQRRLKEMEADRATYEASMSSVLGRSKEGTIKTPAEGNKAIAEHKDAIHRLEKNATELAGEAVSEEANTVPQMESLERSTLWWTGMFTFVAVALGLGLSLLLGRSISRPLKQVADRLQDIAQGEGDLTRRLEVISKDEIGDVAHWFNTFIDKLEGIIRSIGKNTQGLAGSAEELTAVSQQMTSNSAETAAQAHVVSAASEPGSKGGQKAGAGGEDRAGGRAGPAGRPPGGPGERLVPDHLRHIGGDCVAGRGGQVGRQALQPHKRMRRGEGLDQPVRDDEVAEPQSRKQHLAEGTHVNDAFAGVDAGERRQRLAAKAVVTVVVIFDNVPII